MKQKTVNKILVGILIVLVVFIGYSRLTEHKRVTYYVCYDYRTSANLNDTPERAKQTCNERND